jgi:hypothetical protein
MKLCQAVLLLLLLLLPVLAQPGLAVINPPAVPWPSLSEQLQQDHVQPGSALETLIQNNQDFQLLRADESGDDLRFPPWLRVFWRKAHPEVVFSANDPTGGYPLFLNEIYEWMVSHQDLAAAPLSAEEAAASSKSVTLSPNQRISGLQTSPRSESDIRINFWNPSKVIAASNNILGNGRLAQFYSSDGGTTWGQTQLPLINGAVLEGDPAVDWTSDGTAWTTALGIVNSATSIQVQAFKSTDGGATWAFDSVLSSTQTTPDKEMLWADHGATSPFKDNLYVIWIKGAGVYVNRRSAGSWGSPLQIDLGSPFNGQPGGDVKTNGSGDVFAFWPGFAPVNQSDARILVDKSTDGGQTFGPAITVGRTSVIFHIPIPAQGSRWVLIYPSAAAYRTATKNLVYASWTDLTGAPGCTTLMNAPHDNTTSPCKTRVWFARSTDGGATWSTQVMINNQTSLNDQFGQHLAVDETTGVVSIIYCDTVADPGRHKADVWYQSSYDDGVTWGAPVLVTTAPTDETPASANAGNQFGDYDGLSAYAGTFLPTWTDRRNNAREEIWTAHLQDVPTTYVPSTVSLWVSATGNDTNDCNQATPCRTLAGALSRVSAGGEIDILDSGDFGPVTIDKSVTLVSAGPLAGIQAGAGNAITINAGPNDKVVLRGLTLDGLGTGANGISFLAGGALYVENCTVNGFAQYGIEFAPTSGGGKLFVTDTVLRNDGSGVTGGGLHLLATGGPGFVAAVDGLRSENNVFGVKAENLGTITIRNSFAGGNGYSGFSASAPSGPGTVKMLIGDSVSTHNGTSGILANGLATVTLSDVVVTDNPNGLTATSGGQILSFGNNKVQGNTADGAPSQTVTKQ